MEKLIDFANGLTDMDKTWFPILFLRPEKDEKMTNSLVGILALFYGLTGSISLYLILVYYLLSSVQMSFAIVQELYTRKSHIIRTITCDHACKGNIKIVQTF